MDKDVVCIYGRIVLSHKRNEIMPFGTTWMDLENIILNEVSQRRRNIMTSLICGIHKDTIQMNYKTETYSQTSRMSLRLWEEEWGEGIVVQFGMDMYSLLYLKRKISCIAHGTLLNVMGQPVWEGRLGVNICICIYGIYIYMHMYGWVPSLFTWNYYSIVF